MIIIQAPRLTSNRETFSADKVVYLIEAPLGGVPPTPFGFGRSAAGVNDNGGCWQVLVKFLSCNLQGRGSYGTQKNNKKLTISFRKWHFWRPNRQKIHPGSPFDTQIALGAKVWGPKWCILSVLARFGMPQGVAKTAKNRQKGVSNFDVFFGCLLEGFLEGFGSQNGAQTGKNHPKNGSERRETHPPKKHKFC